MQPARRRSPRKKMPAIKPTCVRDLKLRVNIVDVVSRVAAVRKAGSRFKGLCPFHSEKTPSFQRRPGKGILQVLRMRKGRGRIKFVRETEQLSFTEAVETLGQRYGMASSTRRAAGPSREERSLRQELFDLHEQAAGHFHEAFRAPGPTGRLHEGLLGGERRFPAELADEFKIGAAAPDGGGLAARLLRGSATRRTRSASAGSSSSARARPDHRGRPAAPIPGPAHDPDPGPPGPDRGLHGQADRLRPQDDPAREAKYVNSPETPIFTKGNLLFNLDRARTAVGEGRPFVMVEGQLDALRCWQVGPEDGRRAPGHVDHRGTARAPSPLPPRGRVLFRQRRGRAEGRASDAADGAQGGHRGALPHPRRGRRRSTRTSCSWSGGSRRTRRCARARSAPWRSRAGPPPLARRRRPRSSEPGGAGRPRDHRRGRERGRRARRLSRRRGAPQAARLGAPERPAPAHPARGAAPRPAAAAPPAPAPGPGDVSPEHDLLRLCLHFEQLGRPLSAALPHDWIDKARPRACSSTGSSASFENGNWPGQDHLDSLMERDDEKALGRPSSSTPPPGRSLQGRPGGDPPAP